MKNLLRITSQSKTTNFHGRTLIIPHLDFNLKNINRNHYSTENVINDSEGPSSDSKDVIKFKNEAFDTPFKVEAHLFYKVNDLDPNTFCILVF